MTLRSTPKFSLLSLRRYRFLLLGLLRLHQWNRKNCAIQLILEWDNRTQKHRQVFEKKFKETIDWNIGEAALVALSDDRAKEIYRSRPGNDDYELRFSLVSLCNYFEAIAFAYFHKACEQKIVREALETPLSRWRHLLSHFLIAIVPPDSKSHPWPWFIKLVDEEFQKPPPKESVTNSALPIVPAIKSDSAESRPQN